MWNCSILSTNYVIKEKFKIFQNLMGKVRGPRERDDIFRPLTSHSYLSRSVLLWRAVS